MPLFNGFALTSIFNPNGFCNSLRKKLKSELVLERLKRNSAWLDLAPHGNDSSEISDAFQYKNWGKGTLGFVA